MPTIAIDPDQQYSAGMDSVNLIAALRAKTYRTKDEQDSIDRNVRHLEIMITKDFWTTEDLTPLTTAITAGKSA